MKDGSVIYPWSQKRWLGSMGYVYFALANDTGFVASLRYS